MQTTFVAIGTLGVKALIITVEEDIFCNNFLHFRYNKTEKSSET